MDCAFALKLSSLTSWPTMVVTVSKSSKNVAVYCFFSGSAVFTQPEKSIQTIRDAISKDRFIYCIAFAISAWKPPMAMVTEAARSVPSAGLVVSVIAIPAISAAVLPVTYAAKDAA